MKQTTYLILGIIVGIILISGCVSVENPVVINKDVSGVPSSPMDLEPIITQFSEDKTSEISIKVGMREGYKTEYFEAKGTRIEISLSNQIELVEGDLSWEGDIIGDDVVELSIRVKAVENGEGSITANAITHDFPGYDYISDTETVYVLVESNKVEISNKPFTPVSPNATVEKV